MPQPSNGYFLFFGDDRIGRVVCKDKDFPNIWGVLALDDRFSNPTTLAEQRLARFLELTRESMRLVDVMHEQDVSAELDERNRQLDPYNDYVESNDWRLVDDAGAVLPILCPIVSDDGGIVWRWNPEGDV